MTAPVFCSFLYASRNRKQAAEAAGRFAERGFDVVRPPAVVRRGLPIPFFRKDAHYFMARKTWLVLPR